MRHLPGLLGAGALLVLVAGCASTTSSVPAGSGGGAVLTTAPGGVAVPGSPGSVTPIPGGPALPGPGLPAHLPAGAEPVVGTQVNASALPQGYPREVWTEHGGTTLGVEAEQGGCLSSSAIVPKQTATQVTVRVVQSSTAGQAHACPMYLTYKPVTVTLSAPLGQRTVVLQFAKG